MKRSSCASGRGYVPSISMGFCVASTKNGSGNAWRTPAAVTWCSCMASSRAAWVFGGVRLISSARIMFANTGPCTKVIRRPSELSWRISTPVMSAGIRSGVNWMRWNLRWKICAIDLTKRVFASPGAPVIRQWPPANKAISNSSIISFWPMMTFPNSAESLVRPLMICSTSCCSLALDVAGVSIFMFYVSDAWPLMGHRIKDDVYTEWESFFLGELAKIIFVLSLPFPAIPQVGVVTRHHHDAALVVKNCFVMWNLGIFTLPGDVVPLACDAQTDVRNLWFFHNIKNAMEQGMFQRQFNRLSV